MIVLRHGSPLTMTMGLQSSHIVVELKFSFEFERKLSSAAWFKLIQSSDLKQNWANSAFSPIQNRGTLLNGHLFHHEFNAILIQKLRGNEDVVYFSSSKGSRLMVANLVNCYLMSSWRLFKGYQSAPEKSDMNSCPTLSSNNTTHSAFKINSVFEISFPNLLIRRIVRLF